MKHRFIQLLDFFILFSLVVFVATGVSFSGVSFSGVSFSGVSFSAMASENEGLLPGMTSRSDYKYYRDYYYGDSGNDSFSQKTRVERLKERGMIGREIGRIRREREKIKQVEQESDPTP